MQDFAVGIQNSNFQSPAAKRTLVHLEVKNNTFHGIKHKNKKPINWKNGKAERQT